ncbi:hypothetical protein DACRYDRAFT_117167 [Dacryopinax primogenitus]|uniref:Uncharacterized protein n=1 Tax=Dacryopinax primogenitus (strain DJM 731) TaxID=1858805 RepID=M5G4J0_DACPD|nr:uncharacterized protein DACRYDRAFT_117167 [Dacryopinax primogenitus]EJU00747.1 hypothetical protein DACRYDRAFT_117167 [Dacryopinax primogenitus]
MIPIKPVLLTFIFATILSLAAPIPSLNTRGYQLDAGESAALQSRTPDPNPPQDDQYPASDGGQYPSTPDLSAGDSSAPPSSPLQPIKQFKDKAKRFVLNLVGKKPEATPAPTAAQAHMQVQPQPAAPAPAHVTIGGGVSHESVHNELKTVAEAHMKEGNDGLAADTYHLQAQHLSSTPNTSPGGKQKQAGNPAKAGGFNDPNHLLKLQLEAESKSKTSYQAWEAGGYQSPPVSEHTQQLQQHVYEKYKQVTRQDAYHAGCIKFHNCR